MFPPVIFEDPILSPCIILTSNRSILILSRRSIEDTFHTNGPNNTRAKVCRTLIFLMPNFCHAQDTIAKRSKALSASTLIINVPTVHSPTHSSFLFNCAIKAHRFAEGPSVSTDTGKACNTSQFHCFCFLLGHWYAMCPASPHL